MNGPHDIGGMMGFGAIAPEANEPLFHAPWQKRMPGAFAGHGRHPPVEHRHVAPCPRKNSPRAILVTQLLRNMAGGPAAAPGRTRASRCRPQSSCRSSRLQALRRFWPRAVPTVALLQPNRFSELATAQRCGTCIRRGTRACPAICAAQPEKLCFTTTPMCFPDSNAHGTGENPQHLYTLRFKARDVFGNAGDDDLQADLFEPYLEAP